jgi:glycerol-3-phosphate cytidylyltransferase
VPTVTERKLLKNNMKIGFTCSAFDFFHAGHVLMLEEAKTQCDYLIVGLHTDPSIDRQTKNKPAQTTYERYEQLRGSKYVDEIVPYDTEDDLYNILTSKKIDVRIIGEEYKDRNFTGKDLPIQMYYNSRKHSHSSTKVRNKIKEDAR